MTMEKQETTMNEDVSPTNNGGFPSSYVSLLEGTIIFDWVFMSWESKATPQSYPPNK